MIVARGVRGPASYLSPGFQVRIGEIQKIQTSSGRMAGVMITSSSNFTAKVVAASGNVAVVAVFTSSGTQIADTTDLSGMHFFVVVDGY